VIELTVGVKFALNLDEIRGGFKFPRLPGHNTLEGGLPIIQVSVFSAFSMLRRPF
jgi:hypothetical protein